MIIHRRTFVAGLSASLFPLPAFAAAPRSDPEWVRALLTALHPGLYRYQSEVEFARRHAEFARDWARSPALESRYLALTRLLAAIRCGHSYVNPYNQSKAVIARLTDDRRLLPFRFRWIGQQMVVTDDPHAVGLARGTLVRSIDGVPTASILAALLPLVRADGGNDGKRRALLDVRGEDAFEAFDLFYPLLFKTGSSVLLSTAEPSGRRRERAVPTVDRAARLAARRPDPPKGDGSPIWSHARRGAAALITMPSWGLYDSKWNWRTWLDDRFADMARAGVTGLVIDIRANEGGLDCGDAILERLIDRPLAPVAMRRLVRYRSVAPDLRPRLDTWDDSFFELGKDAKVHDRRMYELPAADSGGSNVIVPRRRFAGKVAILTSATNSSATFAFAERVKQHRLATLVGEETGGNQRGINGGAFFFARLPDSGLEFDLPLIGTFADRPGPDAGIAPDVPVAITAAAIASGRDDALGRALRMVACKS